MLESITNRENDEVDIVAPGFSATKIQSLIGTTLIAVLAIVPTQLKEDEQVVIAAIAAGTAIMLGMFALWAADIRTRQRAREASLRYGGGPGTKPASFSALPAEELVLQKGHKADEYEVKLAMVDEGRVSLVAIRDGKTILTDFTETPKPK